MRGFFILVFIVCASVIEAQQYPWWTQYSSQPTLINPGFCGTKRLVDARLSYRNQWTGFDGAPKTYALSINSRLLKGKLGVGGFLFKDDIGPFRNFSSALTLAYHLKFPDSEFSFGVQGNYLSQQFIGTEITVRNQQDKALNLYSPDKSKAFETSAGFVYYNDRFHLGFSGNNLASSAFEYYKTDTLRKGKFKNVPHYSLSAGYNFADNIDYTFENTVMVIYIPGVPSIFDYTMRLHIKKMLMAGFSFRLKDAVALQLGCTIKNDVQVSYSYDIVTSPLRTYQKGSHELKIVFSSNLGTDKRKRGFNNRFLKQRFQYLL